jgi:catechol-2,3-dioxygenase
MNRTRARKEASTSATPKSAHVALRTSHLEQMRDGYCQVLDAHVVYEGHGLCFTTFDDAHHRVALWGAPVQLEPRNPGAAGMHHTADTSSALTDLLARCEELKERGIEPKVPIQHGVTTSLYHQDPDGKFRSSSRSTTPPHPPRRRPTCTERSTPLTRLACPSFLP